MSNKKAGMDLNAGHLIWVDGYKRKLSRILDEDKYVLILMERPLSKRVPTVLEISEDEAKHAWSLIEEVEPQMTKEWFFEVL